MPSKNPSAIDQLRTIQPRDLPQPRQTAIALIKACTRADATTQELADLASRDGVLTAELLRVVNTPFFGLGKEVTAVSRAVTVLGHRALRNLALCLAIRDALQPEVIPGLDPAHHWEDALRRATSAKLLAHALGQDADECFSIGLLQDCGLLVMFMRWPESNAAVPDLLGADPDTRYSLERQHFGVTHDQVAAFLARQWGLPEEMIAQLEHHHACEPAPHESELRCSILYCADWLAAVYSVADKTHVIDRCRQLLLQRFDLDSEATDRLLSAVPGMVEEAAAALSLTIPQQADFQEILREANLRLSEENLSYQELTWRLEKTLRERDELAAELNREIEMAREIQRSLLPAPLSDALVVGVNVPARDLSGDFYDFFRLPDGNILFNLGDVSGKGMNAALLMAKTTSLFRCLGKRIHDPALLMSQINDEICETTIRGMFVTMIAGCYDPRNGAVRLVNAGHPPALLFRGNQLSKSFGAQAPPLGVLPGMAFPVVEFSLDSGTLFIVTDGITEARRGEEEALGIKGLVEMIATSDGQAPRERLERIVKQLRSTPKALHDDMTILMVGNHSTNGILQRVLTVRAPAKAVELKAVREKVHGALVKLGIPDEALHQLVVAVNEACMNVIQHAYGDELQGDMVIDIEREPGWLIFRISDFAPPVDTSKLKPRDLTEVRPGGLGLSLMYKIMDDIRYPPPPEGIGNVVEMRKRDSNSPRGTPL